MARYNHAFTIAFSTVSSDAKGADLDPDALKAALQARIATLEEENQRLRLQVQTLQELLAEQGQ